MRTINKKTVFLTLFGLLTAVPAIAAQPSFAGSNNTTLYALVGLMIILLFVIGVLAHTLTQLAVAARDKMRKDKEEKALSNKTGITLLLLAFLIPFSSFGSESASPALIDGIPAIEFYLLIGFIGLELLAVFALVIFIKVLLRIIRGIPDAEIGAAVLKEKKSWFWDNFNKAASVEKEREILLDHNYDGIQELDNSLPPWWKYGFYLTIVVSIIYLYRFHVSHEGQSQLEEFASEMQRGEEEKTAYLAMSANNVDESNVTLLTDGIAIASGNELFVKNCAACHLADGGGSVGPNLTDDYWLHGGSLSDVFRSIKYGWQDKGMKSWKDDLSPIQIQQVTSFIRSLKGSHPATAKAPQGDIYMETNSGNTATDSLVAAKL